MHRLPNIRSLVQYPSDKHLYPGWFPGVSGEIKVSLCDLLTCRVFEGGCVGLVRGGWLVVGGRGLGLGRLVAGGSLWRPY